MKKENSTKNLNFIDTFVYRMPIFPQNKDINETFFNEALYLSSPVLKNETIKLKNKLIKETKEIKKINISNYKYASRSSSRSTPFGLFAGVGTGKIGDKNEIICHNEAVEKGERRTRPDMNITCKLIQKISNAEFTKPYLQFFLNNTLYKVGDFYRYVEYYFTGNKRNHKISKVDATEYLSAVLIECEKGKKIDHLIEFLVKLDHEITPEEAFEFINQLIDFQILVNELEPTVTGEELFDVFVKNLEKIHKNHPSEELNNCLISLKTIQEKLDEIDQNFVENEPNYQLIKTILESILGEVSETNLFQTDLFYSPKSAEIKQELKDHLIDTIQFLNKITPSFKNSSLDNFKKRFFERYEDQEMPLLEVLDVENGIGYLSKDTTGENLLIDDLPFPQSYGENELKWNILQKRILDLLLKAHKEELTTISITEKDFESVDYSSDNIPHSLAVKFNLLDAESSKISLDSVGGTTACALLGRFGHGKKEIQDLLNEISNHENAKSGDNILAEISHLPESRIGNILSRPKLRDYEIPYLAKSCMEAENQINPSDLYISIVQDKVILRSKKLNKQIIPRLSNAHNYSYNALPFYHLLCDLQNQYYEKVSFYFSWGSLSSNFTFLPRVEYKNIILKPATWQLQKQDFEALQKEKDGAKSITLFNEFKAKHKLPNLFIVADGDNELLIDCSQEIAIHTFIDTLKNRSSILIEEYLSKSEHCLIKDTAGHSYNNECIMILLNNGNEIPSLPSFKEKQHVVSYLPGSEWIYFKVYSGIKTADYLLSEILFPFCNEMVENQLIDKWFFIRYNDPENHLRIRFHVTERNNIGLIISKFNEIIAPLFQDQLITKVVMDTYQPELERYRTEKITETESLFFVDSVYTCRVLEMLDPESGSAIRWHFGLRATDAYLDDLGLNLEEKEKICSQFSQNFFKEFNGNSHFQKELNEKYRKLRPTLENLLDKTKDKEREMLPLLELLNERSQTWKDIIASLDLNLNDEKYNSLVFSYIHMMHNRFFMSNQRKNEFIIYDLLARHYKSILARNKYALKEI